MDKQAIDDVGRGRVWTGQQALERHLVDHLGGLRDALADARSKAFLADDAPIVEYPPSAETLLEKVLALAGGGDRVEQAIARLPPAIQSIARAIAPLMVYRSDEALARMEWVELE